MTAVFPADTMQPEVVERHTAMACNIVSPAFPDKVTGTPGNIMRSVPDQHGEGHITII